MVNTQFWKNKSVFITGHTGFKGSWLCFILSEFLGAKITGYSLSPPTEPNLFTILGLKKKIKHIENDVRDISKLNKALLNAAPDIVIHLAAQPLVQYGYNHPFETFETNIMGTLNLLESLRLSNFKGQTLVITSDKCYLNNEQNFPFKENDSLGGKDPYSASKAGTELIALSYISSYPDIFKGHLATARAGNVIGGGDWGEQRLIPDLIQSFRQNKPVTLRNPLSTRPWQHVLEPLFAYIKLIESMPIDSSWNIGPQPESVWTVQKVTEYLGLKFGLKKSWVQDPMSHPIEALSLRLDSSKIINSLGWMPVLDIQTTLDWVYQWYSQLDENKNMINITYEQTQSYMERIKNA